MIASMPKAWEGAEEEEGSVEARCARIRGRMMWILSQLEGEDADALLDPPAGSTNGQPTRELDDQRQRLEAKHAAEMEQLERRLRVAHQTEVSGLRSELIAAKEQTRTVQVEAAAAQAARAVEQKMTRQEAAGLGEAAALKRQVALYEEAMRHVGPVLASSLETLAMLGRAAPLPEEELEAALELNASLTNAQRVLGSAYPEATASVPPSHERPPPRPLPKPKPEPAAAAAAAVTPAAPKPRPWQNATPAATPAAATPAAKPASQAIAVPPPSPGRSPPVAPPGRPTIVPPAPPPAAPAAATAAATAAALGSGAAAGIGAPAAVLAGDAAAGDAAAGGAAASTVASAADGAVVRGGAASASSSSQPPPKQPFLTATSFGRTHPGGMKPSDARNQVRRTPGPSPSPSPSPSPDLGPDPNQDTFFELRLDEHNAAWGVFDGHGSQNGTLVAEVACATVEQVLR